MALRIGAFNGFYNLLDELATKEGLWVRQPGPFPPVSSATKSEQFTVLSDMRTGAKRKHLLNVRSQLLK